MDTILNFRHFFAIFATITNIQFLFMLKTRRLCLALGLAVCLTVGAQDNEIHQRSETYEWPTDQLVVKNLKAWQDLKFGVLFHWGLYAVPGMVESWAICDENWITRDSTRTYQQYMDWYFGLADELKPTKFDPTQWAEACSNAGMKYMIFTTKHHDGFCMWDSQETDFTIAKHAFKDDPRRDVLKHVLDAFRQKQFTIGTYFSKPDWHSQYYWWGVEFYSNRAARIIEQMEAQGIVSEQGHNGNREVLAPPPFD